MARTYNPDHFKVKGTAVEAPDIAARDRARLAVEQARLGRKRFKTPKVPAHAEQPPRTDASPPSNANSPKTGQTSRAEKTGTMAERPRIVPPALLGELPTATRDAWRSGRRALLVAVEIMLAPFAVAGALLRTRRHNP